MTQKGTKFRLWEESFIWLSVVIVGNVAVLLILLPMFTISCYCSSRISDPVCCFCAWNCHTFVWVLALACRWVGYHNLREKSVYHCSAIMVFAHEKPSQSPIHCASNHIHLCVCFAYLCVFKLLWHFHSSLCVHHRHTVLCYFIISVLLNITTSVDHFLLVSHCFTWSYDKVMA